MYNQFDQNQFPILSGKLLRRFLCTVSLIIAISCIVFSAAVWFAWSFKPSLRIAINPWPGYEFATLAREKGFFDEEKIKVQLID